MKRSCARSTLFRGCWIVVVVFVTLVLSGGTLYAQCLDGAMWGVFPTANALFGFDKQPDSKTTELDTQGKRYYRISWPSGSSSGGAMFKLTLYASVQEASDVFQQRKNAVSGSTDIQIGDEGYTFGPPTPYYLVRKNCALIEAYFLKFATLLQPTDSYLNAVVNALDHLSCQPCHGGGTPPPLPPTQELCDNGVDDDGDGLVDGADPDCAVAVAVHLSYTPAHPTPTEPVCVRATYTNPQGYPFTYEWWYGNFAANGGPGLVPLSWNEQGGCFPNLPQTVSDHLVVINVVFQTPQGINPSSDSLSLRTAYKDLSVALERLGDPHAGQPVSFQADVFPATNGTLTPPLSYTWSVDGVIRSDWSADVVTWTSPVPGPHTVKIEVQDASGKTGWNAATFSISDAGSPPSPTPPPPPPDQHHPPSPIDQFLLSDTVGSDGTPGTPKSTFNCGDTVYAFLQSVPVHASHQVELRWKDPQAQVLQTSKGDFGKSGSAVSWTLSDHLVTDANSSPGSWTVELYLDGQLDRSVTFTLACSTVKRSGPVIEVAFMTSTVSSDGQPGSERTSFACNDPVYVWIHTTFENQKHTVDVGWYDPQGQPVAGTGWGYSDPLPIWIWHALPKVTNRIPGRWTVKIAIDGKADRTLDFTLSCDTNATPRSVEHVMDQDHDGYLNDAEILDAIQYWILGKALPGTDQHIDDQKIMHLIQMWIMGSPV